MLEQMIFRDRRTSFCLRWYFSRRLPQFFPFRMSTSSTSDLILFRNLNGSGGSELEGLGESAVALSTSFVPGMEFSGLSC